MPKRIYKIGRIQISDHEFAKITNRLFNIGKRFSFLTTLANRRAKSRPQTEVDLYESIIDKHFSDFVVNDLFANCTGIESIPSYFFERRNDIDWHKVFSGCSQDSIDERSYLDNYLNKERRVQESMNKIGLGDKVRDSITGFEGTVTSITEWINGCRRVGVQSAELHEGKPIDPQWFDEQQVRLVESRYPLSDKEENKKGGPRLDPSNTRPGERSTL